MNAGSDSCDQGKGEGARLLAGQQVVLQLVLADPVEQRDHGGDLLLSLA